MTHPTDLSSACFVKAFRVFLYTNAPYFTFARAALELVLNVQSGVILIAR